MPVKQAPAPFTLLKVNWEKAWKNTSFKKQAAATLLLLSVIAFVIPYFFQFIQVRPGFRIIDIVLDSITPRNVSFCIFSVIYFAVILGAISLITHPVLLLKCLQAYCLLVVMRMLALYLIPLEETPDYVPLEDPVIGYFFYNNSNITRDLFFSGHVSTLALMGFAVPQKWPKYFFILATLLTALLMLVQHVHYTIDIVAAPAFAWISIKAANSIPLFRS
jgi:hypothetical protein